jgi:tripeptide aminopeptidase
MVHRVHDDLRAAGVQEQHLRVTSEGYLIVELPGTAGLEAASKVALFSHVDTARDFLGDGVVPVVHRNYSGEVITFTKGPDGMVLDPAMFPVLASKAGRGDTIITASGDTLLGADDKSGVAVMVVLAELLLKRQLPHGPLALVFGPDEEVRPKSSLGS